MHCQMSIITFVPDSSFIHNMWQGDKTLANIIFLLVGIMFKTIEKLKNWLAAHKLRVIGESQKVTSMNAHHYFYSYNLRIRKFLQSCIPSMTGKQNLCLCSRRSYLDSRTGGSTWCKVWFSLLTMFWKSFLEFASKMFFNSPSESSK